MRFIPELCGLEGKELIIRNMVCDRCKAAVRVILEDAALPYHRLELGEVELTRAPTTAELVAVGEALRSQGFELVQGRDSVTIARIKASIVQLVHHGDEMAGRVKLSEHLSGALNTHFAGLSALFSEVEGITIEQYFLLQRIERVKELVRYGELTISEIAFATGFSSAAHLSGQFKKLTGMSPSAFRQLGTGPRIPLDRVGRR